MVSNEQIADMVIKNGQRISAMEDKYNSKFEGLEKRVDINDEITRGIHELAANMKHMTGNIKELTDRVNAGFREQGKRIGQLETSHLGYANIINIIAEFKNEFTETRKQFDARLEKIEQEPAKKWQAMVTQITGLIIAAVVGFVISRFM